MQSHEYSSDESQFLISLDKSPKKENDLAESVTKTNSTDRECTAKKQERIILHLQNAENAAPKRSEKPSESSGDAFALHSVFARLRTLIWSVGMPLILWP